MKIKWFGQASFLLTSQHGTRILIDPFHRLLGYRMPVVETEIVAVSHDHKDHSQLQAATGDYMLVNQPSNYEKNDVQIKGIQTYHDKQGGKRRGRNIVFVFSVDGITVCHCGDLGHVLSDEQVSAIGHVDILMIPVGGTMTLGGIEAAEVKRQLQPAITIPMHYRTKALGIFGWLLFQKVDRFLAAAGEKGTEFKELDISKNQLAEYPGVVVLQYE